VILGVGTDIVEVARIRAAQERFAARFLQRLLHPAEIAYCLAFRVPAPHVAARFAAKEAIAKAFGTGIGGELGWHDMEIARHPSGQPHVVLHGRGVDLLHRLGGCGVHLSLSHTADYATAVAVLEGAQNRVA
jgi:holo-[acyl-carrier protein] synthase